MPGLIVTVQQPTVPRWKQNLLFYSHCCPGISPLHRTIPLTSLHCGVRQSDMLGHTDWDIWTRLMIISICYKSFEISNSILGSFETLQMPLVLFLACVWSVWVCLHIHKSPGFESYPVLFRIRHLHEKPGDSYSCMRDHKRIQASDCLPAVGSWFLTTSPTNNVKKPEYGVYIPQYPGFYFSTPGIQVFF